LLCSPQGPAGGSKDDCPTDLFTASGECCRACNVGEGVVQPCGVNQTVCEPCLDSVTFSDTVSATEPCRPCTQCGGLQSMSAPCVESDDAVCVCAYGYFQDESSGSCRECRVCEVGFGLMFSCKDSQDTVCEECPEGTFSSEANFVDPCLPCTTCEDNEVLVRECTAVADAECRVGSPLWMSHDHRGLGSREQWDPRSGCPMTTGDTTQGTKIGTQGRGQSPGTGTEPREGDKALAALGTPPAPCPRRWNSCKQNKQGANNRPVNQTPSPEGEKLHSDSGISVDSQSLHDQQPPGPGTQGTAPKSDGNLYTALPASKQEEVEKLLGSSAEDTWRQLAGELGYKDELIDSFTREESPARALLAHWGCRESATLDALLAALRRLQRGDIADSLASDSTATSPV
ncbi:TNR16 factor, partial [Toxostoma redivivum]|nr:TNR16 factor [Toxostoma redivivum]